MSRRADPYAPRLAATAGCSLSCRGSDQTTFRTWAQFKNATFIGGARFYGGAFNGHALFDRATFGPAGTICPSPFPTAAPITPSVAPRPTISQAGAAYLRIAAPVNRAAAAVNTDLAFGVPFPLTRADDLAYITALRKSAGQLRAIRWPAPVQGYVAAMLLTYPASIACAQAVASAGSNSAATGVLSTNHACAQSQNASDPHQVRMLLHLPSTAGHLPAI